jgi:hypothetical protein
MSTHVMVGGVLGAASAWGGQTLWYATRGAGLVTLLLLTGTVVLGITTSLDVGGRRLPIFVTGALHRNVSFLAVAMLAIHVGTIMVDGYAPVRWIDTVVPFISRYHGRSLGLGVVASNLFLALVLSSALRSRVPFAAWRAIHWAAYLAWPLALWHGLAIGTDRNVGWVIALDVACVAAVAGAVAARLVAAVRSPGRHAIATSGSRP